MQTLTVKLNTQGPPIVLWRAIPAALTITGVAAPAEHWDLIVTAGRTDSPLLTGTVTGTGTTLSASFPAMDSAALAAAIDGKATLACEVTLTDGAAQVYLFPLTVRNRATNTTPPAPVPPDAVRTVNGQPGPEVNLDASDVGALPADTTAADIGAASLDGLELAELTSGVIPAPGKVYSFAPTEAVEMTFPKPVDGMTNAFRLRITMPTPAVAVTWPAALVWRFAIPALAAGTTSELAFSWNSFAWEGWAVPDLSEYARLSGGNTFSGDQILGGGLNAAGKIMQGYGPGSTQWSDAPGNSVSLGSAYATGSYAVATGKSSIARGEASMTVGVSCTVNVSGQGAFCVGNYCSTNRPYTLVAGNYCAAYDVAQLVTGQYNALTSGARVTGNGSGNNARRNIEVLDWQGNLTIAGDLAFTPTGGSATTLAALIARIEALEQAQN